MEIKVRLLNFRRGLWKEKQTAPVGRNSEGTSKEQRSSEFHVQEDTESNSFAQGQSVSLCSDAAASGYKEKNNFHHSFSNARARRGTRLTVC